MSDELFASEFVSVPRQGECTVDSVLGNAGYVAVLADPVDEEMLHQQFKASPWAYHRFWTKEGRSFMFDKWTGHKDKNGWEEPDAVIIRDVTDLLKVSARRALQIWHVWPASRC